MNHLKLCLVSTLNSWVASHVHPYLSVHNEYPGTYLFV